MIVCESRRTCTPTKSAGSVLALAAEEERVVVTRNVRHFAPIARHWAEARRSPAGLILVTSPRAGWGAILRGLEGVLAARPRQDDWIDRVAFLGREDR